ncbi:fasciclin domain-containing protein [Sphingomonas donggukensis]|uniref:Fasciclin domain-containing protein n=1 Tax=Sphingomonas donggukensis TaxID=2949093 RepID=A0ABY4TW29_9SPHN|nr:fasciclin domain-containing protein [Sphingomonas donggukensis]URW74736.1 fasciclin domain-containing protein [Sphingomonas donggukensis]
MKHSLTRAALCGIIIAAAPSPTLAQNGSRGAAAMDARKSIVENLTNSADHTTLVKILKAAGLIDTLSGPGPYTIFAPTNAAFLALNSGAIDMTANMLRPEAKAMTAAIMANHVVAGRITLKDIIAKAKRNAGVATYVTLGGATLQFKKFGDVWVVLSGQHTPQIIRSDIAQSNDILHDVDALIGV